MLGTLLYPNKCRNPVVFLPDVWSLLLATVHQCAIFACPGIDIRVQGTTVFSLIGQTLVLYAYRTRALTRISHSTSRPCGSIPNISVSLFRVRSIHLLRLSYLER
jgi:hypothetical protein